jgi:tetratricopeptide (TPR) repeat protein
LLLSVHLWAQSTKAQLEVNESFFTLGAALNSCGYDAGADSSLPVRSAIRAELQEIVRKSPDALKTRDAICQFWREHELPELPNDASPYVSLGLNLTPPPAFTTTIPEADLPPDAARVLGVASLLQKFYGAAGIQKLWQKHQSEYHELVERFHDPLSKTIVDTDLYLKLPFSSYAGQHFIVYLEPQLSPLRVNSRNYGNKYFIVISPGKEGDLRLAEIRHTYLHFVLDPLAESHGTSLKRIEPILQQIQAAPLNNSFKQDVALMVNECLIRAIETRMTIPATRQPDRDAYVQRSMEEGFVLTRYFFDALATFEKESTGLKTAYGDFLVGISLDREKKRAREVTFAATASSEIVNTSRPVPHREDSILDMAEQKLAAGDKEAAQKLAMQVLQHNAGGDEPARASFLLARIATLSGNMEEARNDFEQAAQSARDPRILAWSHIYLGRIYDIQQNRDAAMEHYRAALAAGDPTPDTKAAAEKGLNAPYNRPKAHE